MLFHWCPFKCEQCAMQRNEGTYSTSVTSKFRSKAHVHHTKRSNALAIIAIRVRRIAIESSSECEGKDPRLQAACNALASEELKNFVCVTVVCLIAANGQMYLKDPFLKCMSFFQKKVTSLVTSLRKTKKTPARVPQPCVLKEDSRVDIERWITQARMFVEDFDEVDRLNLSSITNLGLINERWTEILAEENEDRAHNRDDVKKEIFHMLKPIETNQLLRSRTNASA